MKTCMTTVVFLIALHMHYLMCAKSTEKLYQRWVREYFKNEDKHKDKIVNMERNYTFKYDTNLQTNCPSVLPTVGEINERSTCPWITTNKSVTDIDPDAKPKYMYPDPIPTIHCKYLDRKGCCDIDDIRYTCNRIPNWVPVLVKLKECKRKKGRPKRRTKQEMRSRKKKARDCEWVKALVDAGSGCTCVKATAT